MLNRKFTFGENILFLLCTLILIAAFYYGFLLEPVSQEISSTSRELSVISEELDLEMQKAAKKKRMADALNTQTESLTGMIYPYDNMNQELRQLDEILSAATGYDINMATPTVKETIVRRDVSISFQTDSYDKACRIVEQIEKGDLRCLISDVRLSLEKEPELVKGNLTVTYFETPIGADKTIGLLEEDD